MSVGDKVVWFSSSKSGRTLSFRKGSGTITSITDGIAVIGTPSKGRVKKALTDLTLKTDDTPLSIITHAAARVDIPSK